MGPMTSRRPVSDTADAVTNGAKIYLGNGGNSAILRCRETTFVRNHARPFFLMALSCMQCSGLCPGMHSHS